MPRHHTTPVSIWWLNHNCNIMDISKEDHDLFHVTCDMSYKLYHTLNRKYKMVSNWHILLTEESLRRLHDMQLRYYDGYSSLPSNLKTLVDEVRLNTIEVRNNKLQQITGDRRLVEYSNHKDGLLLEHNIQLEMQKELSTTLKRYYSL